MTSTFGTSNPVSLVRRALVVGVLSAMLVTGTASAAVYRQVGISDYIGFAPYAMPINLDTYVGWHNSSTSGHSAIAHKFNWFWVTVPALGNSVYVKFQHAGKWTYYCNYDDHTGEIQVSMNRYPLSGNLNTVFTITVATANAPAGYTHDIQKRKVGKPWAAWKSTTGMSVTFDPAKTGTFEFRGRFRRTSDGQSTGWSPVTSISVN